MMSIKHAVLFSVSLLSAAQAFVAPSAFASVIVPNTRVIFRGDAREQTVQLTNEDSTPSVMQVWTDTGNPQSTPKTADGPFLVTPPVFRIAPKAGQTVRLILTGEDLPSDRESLFYFNTLQIPSLNGAYAGQNQMLVMLRNRLKLFYRPAGMTGSPQDAPKKVAFHLANRDGKLRVEATNASNYHVTLLDGRLICGTHNATFAADMLAPHADAAWDVKGGCPTADGPVQVKVKYIDDYGAPREEEYTAGHQPAVYRPAAE